MNAHEVESLSQQRILEAYKTAGQYRLLIEAKPDPVYVHILIIEEETGKFRFENSMQVAGSKPYGRLPTYDTALDAAIFAVFANYLDHHVPATSDFLKNERFRRWLDPDAED